MNAIPSFRATDPLSSFFAAQRAEAFKQSHAERILSSLKQHGQASAHELQLLTGLTIVQIDRRLIEMQRAGLIELVLAADGAPLLACGCRVWKAV